MVLTLIIEARAVTFMAVGSLVSDGPTPLCL